VRRRATIADPIHKFKGVIVERAFAEMIFDKNKAGTHASGFRENFTDVVSMWSTSTNIHSSKESIGKQDVRAIENLARMRQAARSVISMP